MSRGNEARRGEILRGHSTLSDPRAAVAELADRIGSEDACLTVLFCSPEFDLHGIQDAIAESFPVDRIPLVGCTSAGEITPEGYRHGAITGFTLPADGFFATATRIDSLSSRTISAVHEIVNDLIARLDDAATPSEVNDTFAFVMIDGLSRSEEPIVSAIYASLGRIPLFGGSAGDELDFGRTMVFHDGAFHSDSAVLTLVRSRYPFRVFKTQHFQRTDKKMVVTGADPSTRIVTEINGEPAAREYARLTGLAEEALTPMIFATHPVVVRVGGTDHVRSIQKVNDDGSLTFFCAIDEGVVLTIARAGDILEDMSHLLDELRGDIGEPQLVLACDCVLRSLELERKQLKTEAGRMLATNNAVGFSTYGEQYQAMHVNQTLTGVAIGRDAARDVGRETRARD